MVRGDPRSACIATEQDDRPCAQAGGKKRETARAHDCRPRSLYEVKHSHKLLWPKAHQETSNVVRNQILPRTAVAKSASGDIWPMSRMNGKGSVSSGAVSLYKPNTPTHCSGRNRIGRTWEDSWKGAASLEPCRKQTLPRTAPATSA